MVHRFWLALFAAGISTIALAQAPQITRLDTTEYGEYALQVQTTNANSANGIPQRIVTGIKQLDKTRVVRLHKDLHFGYRYTIVGTPSGATVNLRMVVIYPSPGLLKPGTTKPIQQDITTMDRVIGENFYRGYTLNDDWMMVPGDWTFEIWYGDRKLSSETFSLVQ